MDTVSIKQLRDNLAQLIEEVAIGGKQIEITKFGKPKAMIIPMRHVKKTSKKRTGLEASFGLWKDRKDMKDSAKWVANLRHRMSSRYGNIFD